MFKQRSDTLEKLLLIIAWTMGWKTARMEAGRKVKQALAVANRLSNSRVFSELLLSFLFMMARASGPPIPMLPLLHSKKLKFSWARGCPKIYISQVPL